MEKQDDEFEVGARVGRYRIDSKIGAGGMGVVYLAEDTELERRVALKVLPPDVGDEDRIRRFVREAKAASGLNHPNILTVYEIGTYEDSRFIATEYIQGETLRQRILREPPSLEDAIGIATQVAAALNAAHDAGIVHRDIKPENVMIRGDGIVKVLDFGLAKLIEKQPAADPEDATLAYGKTLPGMLMGTVTYMSPEQARGRDVDTRSDIWSLGVLIYEMVEGRNPFEGETSSDVIAAILKTDPAAPLRAPHELSRIMRKTLEKRPDERYQTIKDLLLDLRNFARQVQFESEAARVNLSGSGSGRFDSLRGASGAGISWGPGRETGAGVMATVDTQTSIAGPWPSRRLLGVAGLVLLAIAAGAAYFAFAPGSSKSIRSLAILPFTNVGGDPNTEYLSDGLSEALINRLAQLPQLKVISRSSSFKYRDAPDPKQVASELGVEAIVVGRIAPRAGKLQISIEMINAADNTQIWGESFIRSPEDIQAVQEDVARAVSQKLELKLSGDQGRQIAKDLTNDPRAYDLYLNGVYYSRKRGVENIKRSLEYQQQALALDPNFAQAYIELANAYTVLAGSDVIGPDEAKLRARAAVEKALQLDDTLSDAHLALARIENDGINWLAAERSYRRAIELNPNSAGAHNYYAFFLSRSERHDEALAEIRLAQELDPLSVALRSTEASMYYLARRYGDAVRLLSEAVARTPDDTFAHSYLGLSYLGLGEYEKALAEFEQVNRIQGDTTSVQIFLGRVYAAAGRREEAAGILRQLETTDKYVSPGELATLQASLGEHEKAFASLERAQAERDLQLQFLKVDPGYDSIRDDPRFKSLLAKLGFER
jgi:serine/threonine-protein kinase